MQLADITYISWGFPPKLIKKPSKYTINLLTVLLNSHFFNEFVSNYIQDNNIEPVSIKPLVESINNQLDKVFVEDINKYSEISRNLFNQWLSEFDYYKDDVEKIVLELGLPDDFQLDFYLLIQYRAFRDIRRLPWIDYQKDLNELEEVVENCVEKVKPLGAITIEHEVTKQELHKWIDDNWKYISARMKESLPINPIIKTDFMDLKLTNEIFDLHRKGNKPKAILDILSKKYKNNIKVYDQLSIEFINRKLKRYKILLKSKTRILDDTFDSDYHGKIRSLKNMLVIH